MFRLLRLTLEFVAAFIGVMVVMAMLLIWRLESKPMTSTFLTPYVESGIDSVAPGTHTQIAHTLLTWDNANRSIALHADGLQIHDKNNRLIAELPNLDVELSVFGLLLGQFVPKTLLVDHPQIQLERHPDGRIYFGDNTQSDSASDGGDIKNVLARVVDNLAGAYVTHKLEINRVVLNVKDIETQKSWSISIPEITLQRSPKGLTGQALVDVTQEDQTSTLNLLYNYDENKEIHTLSTHFSDITPSFFAGGHPGTVGLSQAAIFDLPLSGNIAIAFDNQLRIEAASLQIHGDDGFLNAPNLWAKPRAVESLDIKMGYDRPSGQLDIPLAQINFGGPTLNLSAQGTQSSQESDNLNFELLVQLNNWPMDQFASLWPASIIPDPRDWIVGHITKGVFNHGEVSLKGNLSWNDLADTNITEATGKITASGAQVTYLDGMPPVNNVNADAAFDLNQMTVQISSGGIGNVKIVPFSLQMTELEKDTQYIDIPLKITGPLSDVLRLLDSPPLGYIKTLGLSPDDITGKIDGQVRLHFPLLKTLLLKDMDITANAATTNMASTKLVPGIDIAQGNLALMLDKTGMNLKGPATLNKVPFQIAWQENFDPPNNKPMGQGSVTGIVSSEQWAMLGVDALAGTKGNITTSLQITQPSKLKTELSGNLDMGGAEIHVNQLNWKKPAGVPAVLKFAADLPVGQDMVIKSIDLHGPQLAIRGNARLSPDGEHLLALDLKPMLIGRTNAALHFTQDDDGALSFKAEGISLDVTGLKGGKEPAHTDPHAKRFQIKVDKLLTSDGGFIAKAEGYAVRDQEGWSEINLHGLADGEHQLNVSLLPVDNHRTFSLTCDDFGEALKGMGFTDTVRDGNLEIHGASTEENPRVIDGTVNISSFSVKDLPVLALLLNATSPFGFTDILTDKASFDHLTGKFRWQSDTIELIQTRVAGSAMGINVDGKVDMNNGTANLSGTLVPFSMVNHVLNYIPLLGDMLTGGEGQGVLAVTYGIKGTLNNPSISVNPISLLTPGFIRNLFFNTEPSEP